MDDTPAARHRAMRRTLTALLAAVLAGCAPAETPAPVPTAPPTPGPAATASPAPMPTLSPGPTPATNGPIAARVRLEVVADGLVAPVGVVAAPGAAERLLVIEQAGRIREVRDGRLLDVPFADLSDRIRSGGERGLLGIALHPAYLEHPRLFVNYTDLEGDTVVSELTAAPDDEGTERADPGSERILLTIDQPYPNHNGGALAFGPDGFLHIATGDGGGGGDPQDHAERLDTLLGKILRIDVDTDDAQPYGIPADNPFAGDPTARPEIAHFGLRNPWRIAFDRETGDLWIGDVGQGRYEELDVARAGTLGLDFGWDRLEGRHCFEPDTGCDRTGLTEPVAEYGRSFGCSVVGGPVYRGDAIPELTGVALFADVCSGLLFGVRAADDGPQEPTVLLETGRPIASLGEDADGEILAVDLGGGAVLRLVPAA
ncbi:MAG TPA: PQQ-dependent sugar dehydrogenase [Candidatus Limnocylindrales bacterium]|nr:PQQ-dependent sugar dehydrogenase [Candidatus Limnocylindrales bacterium]